MYYFFYPPNIQIMRLYRSTNLHSVPVDEIKNKIEVQLECITAIEHLSIYIKNLPVGYEIFGVKINQDPTADAKVLLDKYNNTPDWLLKMTGTTLVPMNDHKYWQDKFTEVSRLLNVSSTKLLNFLQNVTSGTIDILKQVIGEQNRFINTEHKEFVDTYYLEIFIDNKRIISMFIRNIPPIQTHFFIVNDLKYLIDDERELPSSSMFMHSFASSLFNNNHWYTDPVGSMQDILNTKLKSTSHEKTNNEERQRLVKFINEKYYLGTNMSVEPAFKYVINDFMRNLWKTQSLLKHTTEDDKERLGATYEPTVTVNGGVAEYTFNYNKIGGVDTLITLISSYINIKIIIAILIVVLLVFWYAQVTMYDAKHTVITTVR